MQVATVAVWALIIVTVIEVELVMGLKSVEIISPQVLYFTEKNLQTGFLFLIHGNIIRPVGLLNIQYDF